MDTIPAGEFKAKCLGILDQVHESGLSVVVTKRGVPFAVLMPFETPQIQKRKLFGVLKETIQIADDIIEPMDENWDVET